MSQMDESKQSIIDNEVESEAAISDDDSQQEDEDQMECLEAEQDSDGSSSLDLSLKKMSSKMVLSATQQLVCQIPRIKEYEYDDDG